MTRTLEIIAEEMIACTHISPPSGEPPCCCLDCRDARLIRDSVREREELHTAIRRALHAVRAFDEGKQEISCTVCGSTPSMMHRHDCPILHLHTLYDEYERKAGRA